MDTVLTEEVIQRLRREADAKMKEPEATNQKRVVEPKLVDSPGIADQESELTTNKNYWKKRLEDLKENHEKIKMVLEAEHRQGYKDVEGTLSDSEGKTEGNPFEDIVKSVQTCYKENAKESLNCAQEVADFVSSVKSKMVETLKVEKQE